MAKCVRFRSLVNQLLDEGVKPTPTEFAKRGLGYTSHSGSGCTWNSGKYAAARREELTRRGWRYVPGRGRFPEVNGRWVKP